MNNKLKTKRKKLTNLNKNYKLNKSKLKLQKSKRIFKEMERKSKRIRNELGNITSSPDNFKKK